MNFVLRWLPRTWIRRCGQLQFRIPWLRRPIEWASRKIVAREGIIQRGIGQGLRFDATNGYPGYLFGTSEPEEQALLAKMLKVGAVFYDVGANIGFYSTVAARLVGPTGQIFAFEPMPHSAESCRKNARLNGFDHVMVIEGAVGAQSGEARLAIGNSSAVHRLEDQGELQVQVHAVDVWRADLNAPVPDVVMIDVEGAELDVFRGMIQTIRECRPTIMVEVHWLGDRFTEYFESELAPLGYLCATYGGGTIPTDVERFHALLSCPKP